MGWLSDVASNVNNAVNQTVSSIGTMTQGGGINQWGENIGKGAANYLNGMANLTSAAVQPTIGLPSGTVLFPGDEGKYGTQVSLNGRPVGNNGANPVGAAPAVDPLTGMPKIPDYHQVYDPQTMSMLPGYMDMQKANSSGLNTMRSLATSNGDTPWSRAAKGENDAQMMAALDRGAAGVEGQKASDNASMAMQGGLSEGARERNNTNAMKNYVGMSQGAHQGHDLNNLNIMKTDEANKLGMLGNVANQEANQVQGYQQAKGMDNANMIGENRSLNDYNMNKYMTQAAIWGAGKQADATAGSGGKHGMFG